MPEQPGSEHPVIGAIKVIRDSWRVLTSALIGTPLEGSDFHRLAADRGNEAERLLWQFKKQEEKLKKAGRL